MNMDLEVLFYFRIINTRDNMTVEHQGDKVLVTEMKKQNQRPELKKLLFPIFITGSNRINYEFVTLYTNPPFPIIVPIFPIIDPIFPIIDPIS